MPELVRTGRHRNGRRIAAAAALPDLSAIDGLCTAHRSLRGALREEGRTAG